MKEDITPKQAADMVDYYIKLVGVDLVGISIARPSPFQHRKGDHLRREGLE